MTHVIGSNALQLMRCVSYPCWESAPVPLQGLLYVLEDAEVVVRVARRQEAVVQEKVVGTAEQWWRDTSK